MELKHECIELATEWQKSPRACFEHVHELSKKSSQLVSRICAAFINSFQKASEEDLASISIEDPAKFFNNGSTMTDAERDHYETGLRERGIPLSIRRSQLVPENPDTVGRGFFYERWANRETMANLRWSAEVVEKFKYRIDRPPELVRLSDEMKEIAFKIDVTCDALDVLASSEAFPFNAEAALRVSAALVSLTHPDCQPLFDLIELEDAHSKWQYQRTRVLNWLCFKDRTLRIPADPVEEALFRKQKLLARYRFLKQYKYPVMFSSMADVDELWQLGPDGRNDAYMKRGFKELQTFLTDKQFDEWELILTSNAALLKSADGAGTK